MAATTTKTATYKGKAYRLEFIGPTKFGKRAKLAFMDGSKEFWVSADLVTVGGESSSSRSCGRGTLYGRRTGCQCGSIEGTIRDGDCFTCRHDAE